MRRQGCITSVLTRVNTRKIRVLLIESRNYDFPIITSSDARVGLKSHSIIVSSGNTENARNVLFKHRSWSKSRDDQAAS